MSAHPFTFRDAEEGDTNFILSSWLKSFRDSEFAKEMSNAVYFAGHQRLVKDAIARSRIVVAVNPGDPRQIYGWICFEQKGDYQVLHYFYVKEIYRGFGLGTKLFNYIRKKPFVYTHRTGPFSKFADGGIYSVYLFSGE